MTENAGNSKMIRELSDPSNLYNVEKTIKSMITRQGIVKDEKEILFLPVGKGTDNYSIFFKVTAEDSIYDEDLTIMIRPDKRTDARILRLMIQEGEEVVQKAEDLDKPKESDRGVYNHEMAAIQADVKRYLKKYVKKNNR